MSMFDILKLPFVSKENGRIKVLDKRSKSVYFYDEDIVKKDPAHLQEVCLNIVGQAN